MPHVHNGLHEYSRLLDAAARAIGEKSGAQDFTGIERFGETLTPTMDLWALPEWAILRGEILFARAAAVGAVALLFSSLEFVNPATSNVLAVVLLLRNVAGVAAFQTGVDSGAALGAVGVLQGVAVDTRYPQLGEVSRCTITQGQLAGAIALPQDTINPGITATIPYIIRPGNKLMLINPIANQGISSTIFWTERPLLPTENRA